MRAGEPKFAEGKQLARYIPPRFRQENRRAKKSAFMEDAGSTRDGLSVNALEVHSANQIAAIYEKKFKDPRPLAISTPEISKYNDSANAVGIKIIWDTNKSSWFHIGTTGPDKTYVHDLSMAEQN